MIDRMTMNELEHKEKIEKAPPPGDISWWQLGMKVKKVRKKPEKIVKQNGRNKKDEGKIEVKENKIYAREK